MTTLIVERLGNDLILRVPPDAQQALALRAGDAVVLSRNSEGEMSLAALDLDHLLRRERNRAFLRRYREPGLHLPS